MGLTHFPHGLIGFPNIGGGSFDGMRANSQVLFVDGDNGSNGNMGLAPDDAFATIQQALTVAGAWDTIYVFDKLPGTYGEDTVKYTENLYTLKTQTGLKIIGATAIRGRPVRTCSIYGVSGVASPVLDVRNACLTLENLRFGVNTSTTYGVFATDGEDSVRYAFNPIIYNCRFAGFTNAGAAIRGVGLQGLQIYRSTFAGNYISINAVSSANTMTDVIIEGNLFSSTNVAPTEISADIVIDLQGSGYIAIIDNNFAHLLPTGGTNRYISVADVREGIITGNNLGHSATLTAGTTGTGIVCPANVGRGMNHCFNALMAYGGS